MTKTQCNKCNIIPPLDKPDGSLALLNVEKANMFSDHLEIILTPRQEMNQSYSS